MFFTFFVLLGVQLSFGKDNVSKEEKLGELIDYSNIKKVIENDSLEKSVEKKIKTRLKKKKTRIKNLENKYVVPSAPLFWNLLSEIWLVKNAALLNWDFKRPDYGLSDSFEEFLESLGYYEKKFKILVVNSPNISHLALPSSRHEFIFLVGLPFMKSLDLSKLEISLLLFEDILRIEKDYFKKKVTNKKLEALIGSNFFKTKIFDQKLIKDALGTYDKIVFDKGFTFQEQFEVTKKMDAILRSKMVLWRHYYKLLEKIDDLVKSNLLYKYHTKIYPSPEMQINWLRPNGK